MHHYRVTLNGPSATVGACVRALRRQGAEQLEQRPPVTLVWSAPADPGVLRGLSLRYPRARIGVDHFEELGSERTRLLLEGGESIVLGRELLLGAPEDEPGCPCPACAYAVAGEHVDPERLLAVARRVAGPDADPSTVAAPLGLAEALGDLARASRRAGGPAPAVLAGLRDLARAALVAAVEGPQSPAELAMERAWLLTRAFAVAARAPAGDPDAPWEEWLSALVGAAGSAIAITTDLADGGDVDLGSATAVLAEHGPSAAEHRLMATGALVSMCLQTLAVFGAERQWSPASR